TVGASSPLTVSSDVDGGGADVILFADGNTAADDFTINANITTDSANIELYAGDDILHTGGTISTTAAGDISLFAGVDHDAVTPAAGDADGSIQMTSGVVVDSAGAVTMTAT